MLQMHKIRLLSRCATPECVALDSAFVVSWSTPEYFRCSAGANGLAAPRDFQTPVACFEDRECSFTVLHKLCGRVFQARQEASPFDVVAWHGNYAPYKYNLERFCPVNTVSAPICFCLGAAMPQPTNSVNR